jgi:hypothetical protein
MARLAKCVWVLVVAAATFAGPLQAAPGAPATPDTTAPSAYPLFVPLVGR